MSTESTPLHDLARLHGLETSYTDGLGEAVDTPRAALLATLQALGVPVAGEPDAPDAIRATRLERWRRILEPTVASWESEAHPGADAVTLTVRIPDRLRDRPLEVQVASEDGEVRRLTAALTAAPTSTAIEGEQRAELEVSLPGPWTRGYHDVRLETGDVVAMTRVLRSPVRCWSPKTDSRRRRGVFMPLYALYSARSAGIGDFEDLARLVSWAGECGADTVGTLPLLAAFLDDPSDPSPYAPASRLAWNEVFLALDEIPDLADSPDARALLSSVELRDELARLAGSPEVDYRAVMAAKRRVLEVLSADVYRRDSPRRAELESYLARHPEIDDYARFRATMERQRTTWTAWPERQRRGDLRPGDFDRQARDYHAYVQWLAAVQLESAASRARRLGRGLYLDFPLGVHPQGYDVWRHANLFATNVAVGAPPDGIFTRGQHWGFRPIRPDRSRQEGHRHFAACIRNHLRFARMLRMDHVMSLHRVFWIPEGFGPTEGVYVRHPDEELYALLAIESHRAQAVVAGEDLGTVPDEVRPALARHGLRRLDVLQFSFRADAERPLEPVVPGSIASLNTHDTPPFAGFWRGIDIDDRVELGLLDEDEARAERDGRAAVREALVEWMRLHDRLPPGADEEEAALRTCLEWLASGDAEVALVNLEDLWLEPRQQNVPGTTTERPNWRRRSTMSLESIVESAELRRLLTGLGGEKTAR